MQQIFSVVAVVYSLLVLNFYNQSNGFKDHYNYTYSFWKVVPIAFLSLFAFLHGGGLKKNDRILAGLGLVFGGIGDWIIGIRHDGIILGALSFGVGHLFYLATFINHATKIHNRLLIGMLAWGAIIAQVCLVPLLAEHKVAVALFSLYSLLLSAVTIIAISQYMNGSETQNMEGLLYRAIGFALFYASDSFLIMSHTGYWKLYSDIIVLCTYYSAQYLILYGHSKAATDGVLKTPIIKKNALKS